MIAIDDLLLQRWSLEGDPRAFCELVRRHGAMVYGACYRILKNGELAEEIARDCFVQLARLGSSTRHSIPCRLHSMATHQSLMRAKQTCTAAENAPPPAEPPEDGQLAPGPALIDLIDGVIAMLPEHLHEVAVTHLLEQRSHETIAIDSGLSRRAIVRRVAKGVERVCALLQQEGVRAESSDLLELFRTRVALSAPSTLAADLERLALGGTLPRNIQTETRDRVAMGSLLKRVIAALIIALICLIAFISVRERRVTLRDMLRSQDTAPLVDPAAANPPAAAWSEAPSSDLGE